jgi:hypothetical protein
MVYVKTNWRELSMTTQTKLDGLNNMETMNTQSISYITGILHGERYNTPVQMAATYFYAGNDGEGSGSICATLDGHSAEEVITLGIPSGVVVMWNNSIASIPAGWYLCDGTNGTPDLRDKFVVCAGGNYIVGDEYGTAVVTITGTPTIAAHSLTAEEVPKHTHGTVVDTYPKNIGGSARQTWTHQLTAIIGDVSRNTSPTGSGQGHTHTATWSNIVEQSKLPAYHAVCYIMRS